MPIDETATRDTLCARIKQYTTKMSQYPSPCTTAMEQAAPLVVRWFIDLERTDQIAQDIQALPVLNLN